MPEEKHDPPGLGLSVHSNPPIFNQRLPIVGVMGSGTRCHRHLADLLGRWLAKEGVHLLTGGGKGVMGAVSEAFFKVWPRKGMTIGVIPCSQDHPAKPPCGYPNPWVEIPIFTHLPLSGVRGMDVRSRNHINILTSTMIIALPGSAGTASEVKLAAKYQRPIAAFLERPDQIGGLPSDILVTDDFDQLKNWVRSNMVSHRQRGGSTTGGE